MKDSTYWTLGWGSNDRVAVGEIAKMMLAFLSLISRNGIVDFIRNNKSQHIKISYYKVRRRDRRLSSACSKWGGWGEGVSPPFLRLTYHTALITRVVIIIRLI